MYNIRLFCDFASFAWFLSQIVKLGITGKESSAFGGFASPFGEGKRGGPRFKFNSYFLGGGHFKYLYLCGGTPKIIKILVAVPQIIDRVPTENWKCAVLI